MRVTVRLFAAAREAVGSAEVVLELPDGATLGDALRAVNADGTAASVLARCSLLLDGSAETDPGAPLHDGAVVDVLPPFAGG